MIDTETFRLLDWVWDVSAAQRYAAGRGPNAHLNPRSWTGLLAMITIDKAHAKKVDLAKPLIAVPASHVGSPLVIDGWHRIAKALANKVDRLPVIILSSKEEYACRLRGGGKKEN